jgi:hypothetical protein
MNDRIGIPEEIAQSRTPEFTTHNQILQLKKKGPLIPTDGLIYMYRHE